VQSRRGELCHPDPPRRDLWPWLASSACALHLSVVDTIIFGVGWDSARSVRAFALAVSEPCFREAGWPRPKGDRLGGKTRWMWVGDLQHDLVTMITSTLARTAKPICTGGPTGSASGTDNLGVFAYFNNDGHGHAVTNARRLRTLTNS
jgi:hypothetical protein